ncbi:MAG: hypothetical protein ACI4XH_04750 [Acutalibacteraceae bacterium]
MKKVLSILLAMVMIVSLSSAAFAAGGIVTADKLHRVEFNNAGDSESYTFIAPADGIYVLKSEILSAYGLISAGVCLGDDYIDFSVMITATGMYESDVLGGFFDFKSSETYFCAERGQVFTVVFEDESYAVDEVIGEIGFDLGYSSEDFIPSTAKFIIEKADVREIEVGGTYTVENGNEMFLFAPDKDGYYNFRSQAEDSVDPTIFITRSDGMMEDNDDNGYKNDYNFDLTTDFQAGKVYMVECSTYSYDEEATGSYTFTVSDGSNIKADYLEAGSSYLTVAEGNFTGTYINVVPTGALADVDTFNVYVADESVANAYIVDGYLEVEGLNTGRTTVTVEDPDSGATLDIPVIVYPQSIQAVIDVFDVIIASIYSIVEAIISAIMSYLPF